MGIISKLDELKELALRNHYECEDCFYACPMSNVILCRKCQLAPQDKTKAISRPTKLCKYDLTGTPEKPHIHVKCIGTITK